MVGLGYLPGGSSSDAFGLSADGSTIVGYSIEAFLWTSRGGMVGLGVTPTGQSEALAVSADGKVVVGDDLSGYGGAWIWTQGGGMRDVADVLTHDYGLNLAGWTLNDATGVSADGTTIVGDGTDPNGNTAAWIATIPEPNTSLLVMVGVLGLAVARRRRA
jgi:uncharacterized membrane protein